MHVMWHRFQGTAVKWTYRAMVRIAIWRLVVRVIVFA